MMKLLRLFLFLVLAALAGAGFAYYQITQPYQGFSETRVIEIPHGTGTAAIAKLLAANGVVRKDWLFLVARVLSPGMRLQAGDYKFEKPASPLQVYNRIARGDIVYLEVTIPEGQNLFEIAKNVAQLKLFTEKQFLAAAHDASSIRDLDPDAPSLEGYLWPDTYRVLPTTTAPQLCAAMTRKFRTTWASLKTKAAIHETITLASLVEREARVPQDRPLVASVFQNRIRLGMKLECDPTTVYAALIENRFRGKIFKSDLESESPWNTYRHMGLPPGPIANPGLESIKAALSPAESKYLFFVAKPDGSGAHTFSENLSGHSAATADYRRSQPK